MLLPLIFVLPARAADILIVKTSDADPYGRADTALRERLLERHYAVRTILMKEASDRGLDAAVARAETVIAVGTPAARWLHKQLSPRVRLVYCMVTGADDAGLLQGRAAWGVTTDVALADQFKLITEGLPRARTVSLLYRSDAPEGRAGLAALTAALPAQWRAEAVAVNDYPSIAAAIDALTQKAPDIIWTSAEQKIYDTASVRTLLLAALRSRVPVWGFSTAFVRAGALLGVGVEPRAQGIQAADLAIRLIDDPHSVKDGASPPQDVQLAVNLIVAAQLGIELPEALPRRAAYVFRSEK